MLATMAVSLILLSPQAAALTQVDRDKIEVATAIAADFKARPWYAARVKAEPWVDTLAACLAPNRPPCIPRDPAVVRERFAEVLGARTKGRDSSSVESNLRVMYRLSDIRFQGDRAFITVFGSQVIGTSGRFTQYDYTLGRGDKGIGWVVLERRTQGS